MTFLCPVPLTVLVSDFHSLLLNRIFNTHHWQVSHWLECVYSAVGKESLVGFTFVSCPSPCLLLLFEWTLIRSVLSVGFSWRKTHVRLEVNGVFKPSLFCFCYPSSQLHIKSPPCSHIYVHLLSVNIFLNHVVHFLFALLISNLFL